MVYCSNTSLTQSEMEVNAQYIYDVFTLVGWSKNAIAGMLGNMQTESTINPGRWQIGYTPYQTGAGFGLVQWTPWGNYFTWATAYYSCTNDEAITMDREIDRIKWELANNAQWIATELYPMTFTEFTTSTETPEYLASVFLKNYERADDEKELDRRNNAAAWYSFLDGSPPDPEPEPTPRKKAKPYLYITNKRRLIFT